MMSQPLRVLMMGTPEFAVPVLESLLQAGYQVVGVFTQPDKPVGRRRVLTPPSLKVAAQKWGLPVFQPASLRQEAALQEVRELRPDLAVTAAYGQLLPQRFLDIPTYGCLNVHGSLLPRWRGAAPIQRALMVGDKETGITIMKTVLALDAGPVLGNVTVEIASDDTYDTLHDKLAQAGSRLLVNLIPNYVSGQLEPKAQEEAGVTYAERILRADELIDFSQSVQTVYNHLRALTPAPGGTASFQGQPMKLWSDGPSSLGSGEAGQIGEAKIVANGETMVRCADGWLRLTEVQPAGKRRMLAADWVRGQKGQTVLETVRGV